MCSAILSVYDKTGLLDLAKGLVKHDIRLLASGMFTMFGTMMDLRGLIFLARRHGEVDTGGRFSR